MAGLLLILIAPEWACGSAWAAGDDLAYAIKATYLCKLPPFVTWPPDTRPNDQFIVCVVGDVPFGDLIGQAAQGQTVQQTPIVVRRYQAVTGNPGCQVMFVAGTNAQPVAAVLGAVRGTPVLTVTDGQSSRDQTGIINFVLVDGHVRFQIDLRSAAENSLVISSKLLSLATNVRDAGAP